MNALITPAIDALKSLCHWHIFKVFIGSIVLNSIVLALLFFGVYWLIEDINLFGTWDWVADIGFTFFAGAFVIFIFPILLPIIISFFDTAIAESIERDEYPGIPTPEPPFWPTIMQDVRFTIKAVFLNALCLPIYLIPGINLMVYYLLNGYLLGTEFFNVVAGRHVHPDEADRMRKERRTSILFCGFSIAVGATIPFINLITPIWGVALMVHLFHSLKPHYKAN
ncbi:MAG: EI24 domain-containing protein [Rickettsiales bacterium]|nr:EI24 domain-containing protein [Rickettsiales bacterium]